MHHWMPIALAICMVFTSAACTKSARLGRRCKGGDGAACTELAGRMALGRGATRDHARAAQLFRDAARAYDRSCSNADAAACLALGDAREKASGVTQDFAAAAQSYEKGCSGGSAIACQKLASLHALEGPFARVASAGLATPVERSAESMLPLQQACDGGNATACLQLGLTYSGGSSGDAATAATYYRKACDAGNAEGCSLLGSAYGSGQGVPQDSSQASRLVQRAGVADLQSTRATIRSCEQGLLASCVAFANLCLGPGGPPNWMRTRVGEEDRLEKESVQILEDLCSAEYWTGCTRLALFHSESNGPFPPKNAAKAMALYQRACDGGLWTACRDGAQAYEYGPGMPHDTEKAVQLYQQACDHGLLESCSRAESLTRPPALPNPEDAQASGASEDQQPWSEPSEPTSPE